MRLVLALALLACVAAAYLLSRGLEVRQGGFLPVGTNGVIVTDLSASISEASNRRIAAVLENVVEGDQLTGLVVFSDTAYELVPPRTRGVELRPLLRFVRPLRLSRAERLRLLEEGRGAAGAVFMDNPWQEEFRGGTRISAGLRLAKEMLARDKVEDGSVLLVSDLDYSPLDFSDLTQTLLDYRTENIPLRIVSLFAAPDDRALFSRMLGTDTVVDWRELRGAVGPDATATFSGALPMGLLLVGALAALLLAINELRCGRLVLPRRSRP